MLLHPVYTERSRDQNPILAFLLCFHSYYQSLAIYMHVLLNQNSWNRHVNVHISAAYQCSCLNLPLIAILLTDQALTLSTYKTLI